MLNMLLAIIFATYDEIRSEMVGGGAEIETLWSQTYEIYRRGMQTRAKQRVNLTHIEASIRSRRGDAKAPVLREKESLEESTEFVTFPELLAMVPGLEMRQAQRLAKNSNKFAQGVSSLALDERNEDKPSPLPSPKAERQNSTETPQEDGAGNEETEGEPLGEPSGEVLSPLPGGESSRTEVLVLGRKQRNSWDASRLERLERLNNLLDDERLGRLERILEAAAVSRTVFTRGG